MLRICFIFAFVAIAHMTSNCNANYSEKVGANATTPARNFKVGERQRGDGLVYHETIEESSVFWWFAEYTFTYPNKTQNEANGLNITYIEVKDLTPDGYGAYGSVTKGGPGSNNVTIEFYSSWSGPINSSVNIFGKQS